MNIAAQTLVGECSNIAAHRMAVVSECSLNIVAQWMAVVGGCSLNIAAHSTAIVSEFKHCCTQYGSCQ